MTDRRFLTTPSAALLAGAGVAGTLGLGLLVGLGMTWLALPDRGDMTGSGRYLAERAAPTVPSDLDRAAPDLGLAPPAPTIDQRTADRLTGPATPSNSPPPIASLMPPAPVDLRPTALPAWMQPGFDAPAPAVTAPSPIAPTVRDDLAGPAQPPAPAILADAINADPLSMAGRANAPLPAWSDGPLDSGVELGAETGADIDLASPPAAMDEPGRTTSPRPATANADDRARGPLPAWMQPADTARADAGLGVMSDDPSAGDGADRTVSLSSLRAASGAADSAVAATLSDPDLHPNLHPDLNPDFIAALDLPDLSVPTAGANGLIPPIDKDSLEILQISRIGELTDLFAQADFSYQAVRDADRPVPRLLIASFPQGIEDVGQIGLRKSLFFNTLLPIVLQVNEAIAVERARLMEIDLRLSQDLDLTAQERAWLTDIAERYEADADDLDTLLTRVDMVPPSMALAQSAVESGWGTSTMARQGNALFGQITTADSPLVDGNGVRFAAFDTLYDSAEAYARNLNTHPAYRDFRSLRADMRQAGDVPNGYTLMGTLTAYSELGGEYIAYVRRLMRANGLQALDDARLEAPFTLEASL